MSILCSFEGLYLNIPTYKKIFQLIKCVINLGILYRRIVYPGLDHRLVACLYLLLLNLLRISNARR